MTDMADLYDSEIAAVAPILQQLQNSFSRRENSKKNLDELASRAQDAFLKVGLVVEINLVPCLIADQYGKTGPPQVVILGRVPGSKLSNIEQGHDLMDHERKRAEVLASKVRGEAYLGQKERTKL